ncbi:hypothetical protein SO802_016461 [Lithocarpus litseifolius]|uniref:Ycf15 n=1 Tax=Lithocarpus litseifolius TaxID=425828 RepID=A0AAW2D0R9_9ROSI
MKSAITWQFHPNHKINSSSSSFSLGFLLWMRLQNTNVDSDHNNHHHSPSSLTLGTIDDLTVQSRFEWGIKRGNRKDKTNEEDKKHSQALQQKTKKPITLYSETVRFHIWNI